MIVTVTPNPGLDKTLLIDRLDHGEVIRVRQSAVHFGGKGVNVARNLAANGHGATAVFPSRGNDGLGVASRPHPTGLSLLPVEVGGENRWNYALVEGNGTTTKINEPGPRLDDGDVDRLLDAAGRSAQGARWVVGAGSLPPGADANFYGRLIEVAKPKGCMVAIDSSGPALATAIEAGADLIKPNLGELLATVGGSAATLGEAVEVAVDLRKRRGCDVLLTLGADGAVLVTDSVVHGEVAVPSLVSSVGAGDALLAGYLATGGGDDALAVGLAWAGACCEEIGPQMSHPTDVASYEVNLHDRIDHDRPLKVRVTSP